MTHLVQVYRLPSVLVKDVAVAPAADAGLVEGHDVLGQGPGLVAEHVLYLAQLLVQSRGPGLCVCVRLDVVHFLVPVYQL